MRRKLRLVVTGDPSVPLETSLPHLASDPDFDIIGKAHESREAIRLVHTLCPDILLVLADIPAVSAVELAEELQSSRGHTVIVIITSTADIGNIKRALNAGVRGYLLGSTSHIELSTALHSIGRGSRVITTSLAAEVWNMMRDPLTSRDRAILRLVESGQSSEQIARLFALSPGTLRNYVSDIVQKVGVRNRVEASRIARQNGWL